MLRELPRVLAIALVTSCTDEPHLLPPDGGSHFELDARSSPSRDGALSEDASAPDAWFDAGMAATDSGEPSDAAPEDAGRVIDLGWPLDTALPQRCDPRSPDPAGMEWDGWGNLQYPEASVAQNGEESEPFYGQVYRQGQTDQPGGAPGWEAELLFGPFGSLPTGPWDCFGARTASFNTDVGNNDEYLARTPSLAPGLHGLFFRYRPSGGAWLYGDLGAGSSDGLSSENGALLEVEERSTPRPLILATLNLRCQADDWPARLPLVVRALARIDPDLVALQENCTVPGEPSQAEAIRVELSAYTRRGYQLERVTSHQATHAGQSFEEGIAVLSAHRIASHRVLELSRTVFPRKALVVELTIRGRPLSFYATHFEVGADQESARVSSAETLLADLPRDRLSIIGGDFNAEPESEAVLLLRGALSDLWALANPNDSGLTFPAVQPTVRIDYLFSSAPDPPPLGALRLDENDGGTYLSDHRGVAVALSWP